MSARDLTAQQQEFVDAAAAPIGPSELAAQVGVLTLERDKAQATAQGLLGEVQRLNALVRELGGNPDPDAPKPNRAQRRARPKAKAKPPAG